MPLDTIKTLQQAGSVPGAVTGASKGPSGPPPGIAVIARRLWAEGGVRPFYRGGLPVLLGGGFMRSAQFGVNAFVIKRIRDFQGGSTRPEGRFLGCIDPQVVIAGFCGGIGRGLVEAPVEMIKVRKQVVSDWSWREILKGSGTTLSRNAFLFSSFVVYMDISKQIFGPDGLSAFWTGAVCSNLAWLTIWPMDVVKSRLQSGKFEGKGMRAVMRDVFQSGALYRGLGAGMSRSFLANGVGMECYAYVQKVMQEREGMQSRK